MACVESEAGGGGIQKLILNMPWHRQAKMLLGVRTLNYFIKVHASNILIAASFNCLSHLLVSTILHMRVVAP